MLYFLKWKTLMAARNFMLLRNIHGYLEELVYSQDTTSVNKKVIWDYFSDWFLMLCIDVAPYFIATNTVKQSRLPVLSISC